MFRNEILYKFAEVNNMTYREACYLYDHNAITPYELFDAFLKYEGIIGYTDKIITTYRELYKD